MEFLGKISIVEDLVAIIGVDKVRGKAVVDPNEGISVFDPMWFEVEKFFVEGSISIMDKSSFYIWFKSGKGDGDVGTTVVNGVVVQVGGALHHREFPKKKTLMTKFGILR